MSDKHSYTVQLEGANSIEIPYWSMSQKMICRGLVRDWMWALNTDNPKRSEGMAMVLEMSIVMNTLGIRDRPNPDGSVSEDWTGEAQLNRMLHNSEKNYNAVWQAIFDKQIKPMFEEAQKSIEQERDEGEADAATGGNTSSTG